MPFDPRFLLLLVPILAGLIGQYRVRATFARYREVPAGAGVTGGGAAGQLLERHGLSQVRLERIKGTLRDHFDSDAKTLRLSDDVADGRSVAALAVAAHEVAHAHQDVERHRTYRLRMRSRPPVMRYLPNPTPRTSCSTSPDSAAGLSGRDVEAAIERHVDIVLPRSPKVPRTVNQGTPVIHAILRDRISRSLTDLVNRFAHAPDSRASRRGGRRCRGAGNEICPTGSGPPRAAAACPDDGRCR